ncbi:hypothetical protein QA612_19280 [Evansella sp. AB-P1]|uniref:hypothetical protein n=1 Tax=Evansella sp. AB-P1 TaxID=3037653 RepID=UPI00241C6A2A|nr:hypothetical protein [Evansella sp. AB-P1]MDG5789605.1 hypothetical protein [Evansella sp. AB-P1]
MENRSGVREALHAVDIVLRSIDHAKQFLTDGHKIITDPTKEEILLVPENKVEQSIGMGYIVIED